MSDQVRGVIFVILALIILFAFGRLYKPAPAPVAPAPQTNSAQTPQQSSASANPAASGAATQSPATGIAMSAAKPVANPGVVQASTEKTFVVTSPLYFV